MIIGEEFRESGVGSRAWYLQVIKDNPDRKGYSYIRTLTNNKLQFDEVKTAIETLVHYRYLDKHSKPGVMRSDRYTVTSFGHRYLHENMSDIDGAATTEEAKPKTIPRKYTKKAGPVKVVLPGGEPVGEQKPVVVEKENPVIESDTPADAKGSPDNLDGNDALILSLKEIAGKILYKRYARNITVLDVVDYLEGNEVKND